MLSEIAASGAISRRDDDLFAFSMQVHQSLVVVMKEAGNRGSGKGC